MALQLPMNCQHLACCNPISIHLLYFLRKRNQKTCSSVNLRFSIIPWIGLRKYMSYSAAYNCNSIITSSMVITICNNDSVKLWQDWQRADQLQENHTMCNLWNWEMKDCLLLPVTPPPCSCFAVIINTISLHYYEFVNTNKGKIIIWLYD